MADSDDALEHRVTVLERGLVKLREQAALATSEAPAARVLAAGADHDVSQVRAELRAHTRALNTLRETQLEQGQTCRNNGRMLQEHLQQTSQEFATMKAGMAQIRRPAPRTERTWVVYGASRAQVMSCSGRARSTR